MKIEKKKFPFGINLNARTLHRKQTFFKGGLILLSIRSHAELTRSYLSHFMS